MIVECLENNCLNEGVDIIIADYWLDAEGNEHPVTEVYCGPCGKPVLCV